MRLMYIHLLRGSLTDMQNMPRPRAANQSLCLINRNLKLSFEHMLKLKVLLQSDVKLALNLICLPT